MVDRLSLHFPDDHPEVANASLERYLLDLGQSVLDEHTINGTIDIVLADDKELQRLNSSFRGIDRPTDVLSFSLAEGQPLIVDDSEIEPAGEIYVSIERAAEQAADLDVSLNQELGRLIVHGLLHLAGYDHDSEETLQFMESETQRFLDLYAVPVSSRAQ